MRTRAAHFGVLPDGQRSRDERRTTCMLGHFRRETRCSYWQALLCNEPSNTTRNGRGLGCTRVGSIANVSWRSRPTRVSMGLSKVWNKVKVKAGQEESGTEQSRSSLGPTSSQWFEHNSSVRQWSNSSIFWCSTAPRSGCPGPHTLQTTTQATKEAPRQSRPPRGHREADPWPTRRVSSPILRIWLCDPTVHKSCPCPVTRGRDKMDHFVGPASTPIGSADRG